MILALLPSAFAAKGPADPGGWIDAANLLTGRTGHTATLLQDGRVLVAGGEDGFGHGLSSAEVFDPQTNRWRSTGSMSATRVSHTSTLLPDGRVLVSGGFPNGTSAGSLDSVATTEIYDPRTGRWRAAAPMAYARARHTATLLHSGKVLVVGGIGPISAGSFLQPVAEVYDPTSDRWEPLPGHAPARESHSAVLLSTGRVYVVGGELEFGADPGAYLYDPVADAWLGPRDLGSVRYGATATLLPHDLVLILGGLGVALYGPEFANVLSSGELVIPDIPTEGSWSPIAPMPDPHAGHTATLLETGRVLVVGGVYTVAPALLYDPGSNSWVSTGPRIKRYGHTATLLNDGRVLIAGGYGALTSATIYDPVQRAVTVDGGVPRWFAIGLLIAVALAAFSVLLFVPGARWLRAQRAGRDPDRWIQ